MSCNAMLCIKRTKGLKEALRLCECAFGGGCEQGQISAAPKGEFKGEGGKISHLNFSGRKGGQRAFFAPCPEAIAGACRHTASAALALGGFCTADLFCNEAGEARACVIARAAGDACVKHHADIFDGQRGFGDGGC